MKDYCEVFRAEHIEMLYPFQIVIYEEVTAEWKEYSE